MSVSRAEGAAGRRLVAPLLLGAALLSLAVPVILARVPPILDYPNHLARMWLLAGGAREAPTSHMYEVAWGAAQSNIAIDLVAAALGPYVPIFALGRMLALAALLAPPLGAIALHRSLFGKLHWWQTGFPLLAFSQTMLAGFLNFQIGLGLALAAAAADRRLARRGLAWASLGRAAAGGLLVVVHPFALFFYAVLLTGLAAGRTTRALTSPGRMAAMMGRAGLAVAAACAPLALWRLATPGTGGGPVEVVWQGDLAARAQAALAPLLTYDLGLDTMFALALAVPLLFVLRRGRLHFGLLAAALALGLVTLAAPIGLGGTWWIAPRFSVMAALALVCAVQPEVPRMSANAAAAAMTAVVLAKSGWIGAIWLARQADIRAVEAALAHTAPGAAILVAENVADREAAPLGRATLTGPAYWHFAALATPERRAFVPTLFTAAGKQPLRVRPAWRHIAAPEGWPPSVDLLAPPSPAEAQRRPEREIYRPPYLRDWARRFDYLLVVNADLPNRYGPFRRPANVALVTDEGFARLYRIERGSGL